MHILLYSCYSKQKVLNLFVLDRQKKLLLTQMLNKDTPFCWREIKYPETLYISCVKLLTKSGRRIPYFLYQSIPGRKETLKDSKQIISQFRKNSGSLDNGILIKIKLDKLFQLKKEFWENPRIETDFIERASAFVDLTFHSQFYKILVVPRPNKNSGELLSVVYPFLRSVSKEDIELFMRSSKECVDPSAKYAAFYLVERIEYINWMTGKRILPEEKWIKN